MSKNNPPLPSRSPPPVEAPPSYTLEDGGPSQPPLQQQQPSSPAVPSSSYSSVPQRPAPQQQYGQQQQQPSYSGGGGGGGKQQQQPSSSASSNPTSIPTAALAGELALRGAKAAFSIASVGARIATTIVSNVAATSTSGSSSSQQQARSFQTPQVQPTTGYEKATLANQNQQQQQQQQGQFRPLISSTIAQASLENGQSIPYESPRSRRRSRADGPADYWAPIYSANAWMALFYYLGPNFILALFGFIWVLVTLLVSAVLLVIFPVGYPLLFLSTVSWRFLAQFEKGLMQGLMGKEIHASRIWINRPEGYSQEPFQMMKGYISAWSTWKIAGYYLFLKPLPALFYFVNSVFTLAILVPFFCIVPCVLESLHYAMIREIYVVERLLY